MTLSEFIRIYPLRAKNIAWLFGAGSSVTAGMPTAWDLVWQFKRMIYCTEERYRLPLFKNLSDPAIRRQIQSYFDSKGGYPAEDSIEEYSFYFEKAFSTPLDRRIFLMEQLSGMQNSFGHKVLGVLMKNALANLVFTTNFDKAFENAAVDQLNSTDKFFTATTDNSETSLKNYKEGKRPFICKLHGDYFSENLKNTAPELQSQDEKLRSILFHACLSNGLAIMGYSGRDESIIKVLDDALGQSDSYPMGIFWFIKADSSPIASVTAFLEKAKSNGIDVHLIEIETFDTAMADIAKGIANLPTLDVDKLNRNYFINPVTQIPPKGTEFPAIRFNAITVLELPATARLIQCSIGNHKEVNALIKANNYPVIATRKHEGVVGFGPDEEFEKMLAPFSITDRGVYQIPDKVIQHDDSTLKGLLTTAMMMGLSRGKPLLWTKRRERYLLFPDYKKLDDPLFDALRMELGNSIFGTIPSTHIKWLVAVEIELQKKLSGFFMVVTPTVLATKTDSKVEKLHIAPFIKEYMARWFNAKYARILDLWLNVFFEVQSEVTIQAFESKPGFNASFRLKRNSPFTRKS